jgi:hypothetical protein
LWCQFRSLGLVIGLCHRLWSLPVILVLCLLLTVLPTSYHANVLASFPASDLSLCLVLSCLALPCLVLPCLVLRLVLPCLVLSCIVLPCLVLSCVVLSCLVLSRLVVSCLALSVLSCRVMSCHFWSDVDLSCLILVCVVLCCLGVALCGLVSIPISTTLVLTQINIHDPSPNPSLKPNPYPNFLTLH